MLPWFFVVWSALWSLVSYQFFEAFFRNLFKSWPWGHAAAIGIAGSVLAALLVWVKAEFNTLRRAEAAARSEKAKQRTASDQQEEPNMGVENFFDPYAILEIEPPATPAQIKSSYIRAMALYHPDKVEHLGSELRKLAHEKTIQIRRAFEVLNGVG